MQTKFTIVRATQDEFSALLEKITATVFQHCELKAQPGIEPNSTQYRWVLKNKGEIVAWAVVQGVDNYIHVALAQTLWPTVEVTTETRTEITTKKGDYIKGLPVPNVVGEVVSWVVRRKDWKNNIRVDKDSDLKTSKVIPGVGITYNFDGIELALAYFLQENQDNQKLRAKYLEKPPTIARNRRFSEETIKACLKVNEHRDKGKSVVVACGLADNLAKSTYSYWLKEERRKRGDPNWRGLILD